MSAPGQASAEHGAHLSFGNPERARTRRRWPLRIAAVAIPVVVGVVFLHTVREGFGPARLAAKSLVPFGALLPLAVFLPPGPGRRAASVGVAMAFGWSTMGVCVAVFGVPLEPDIMAGFLGLIRPGILAAALAAAVALGVAWRRIVRSAPAPAEAVSDALLAVTEGVYFGGFLIGGTGHMEGWLALPIIAAGQTLVAGVRGVPAWRALLGAVLLTGAAFWVGNVYAAIVVHLALLGSPPLRSPELPAGAEGAAAGRSLPHSRSGPGRRLRQEQGR